MSPANRAGGLSAALLALACGGSPAPTHEALAPPAKDPSLVGTWESRGDDPQLGGAVVARLELTDGGSLRLTVSSPTAGSLRFTGSWALEDSVLILRGAYFGEGEVRVTCQLLGDSLLVLQDGGTRQEWRRRQ